MVAHNGPTGLGNSVHSPCGADWLDDAVDHGDADLQAALCQLASQGRPPSVLVFGHMHSLLARNQGLRDRVGHLHGTVCLNAAVVPRTLQNPGQESDVCRETCHHFLEVRIQAGTGRIDGAEDVWVGVKSNGEITGHQRKPLLRWARDAKHLEMYRHHTGDWAPMLLQAE